MSVNTVRSTPLPPPVIPPGLHNERQTIEAMVKLFCKHQHHSADLCDSCSELLQYAEKRLSRCPFGEAKPQCEKCSIHCYTKTMRARVTDVMRYAGPRMIYTHPVLAIKHLLNRNSGIYDKAQHHRQAKPQSLASNPS